MVRKSSQPKQPPAAAEAPAPAAPEQQPAPAGAAAVVSPSPITSPEVGTDSEAAKGNIFLTNLETHLKLSHCFGIHKKHTIFLAHCCLSSHKKNHKKHQHMTGALKIRVSIYCVIFSIL